MIARDYLARGWAPIPVPARTKKPIIDGWQRLRIGETDLPRYFGRRENVGVLLGEPSAWLVDVDLDHPLAVELASQFLPATPAVFGRDGKQRSHWLYVAAGAVTKKCRLDKKTMIVELRSTGCQTIMPGSVHPSGEAIAWATEGEPAEVDADTLRRSVEALAAEVVRRVSPIGDTKRPHREQHNGHHRPIVASVLDRARKVTAQKPLGHFARSSGQGQW